MVLYQCSHCNFSTTLKANYNRHEKTKKHRVNAGIDENHSSSDGNNEQNEHKITKSILKFLKFDYTNLKYISFIQSIFIKLL